MEPAAGFSVTPSEGERPGAFACFPFDRALVERFRDAFPRARWRDDEACWFVPGTTAARRLDLWISRELSDLDRHADDKGRDAYAFEPLRSRYLEIADDLLVRTPYSRTVVAIMRTVPWARWDPEQRAWRVPFRSYDDLRQRWPEIEEGARRNEPEARRRRREEREPSPAETALRAERRKRRYPVPASDPPPLGRPVTTAAFGVVTFDEVTGEVAEVDRIGALYAHVSGDGGDYTWATWRMPTWRELAATKPTDPLDDPAAQRRSGWWPASADELAERRRSLRTVERARRTRGASKESESAS